MTMHSLQTPWDLSYTSSYSINMMEEILNYLIYLSPRIKDKLGLCHINDHLVVDHVPHSMKRVNIYCVVVYKIIKKYVFYLRITINNVNMELKAP